MIGPAQRRRIELTASCRDCDPVPKVADGGAVRQHGDVPVQVMHNGVLIEEGCYYGAWMTEVIRRLGGHHEPQEEAAFRVVVERLRRDVPAPIMVELGSFWAYYSLWLQHAIAEAVLVCVEPDPAYLEVGRRNAALNGARARFIQAAVGRAGDEPQTFRCESDGVEREIPVVTLTDVMATAQLDRVDLLLCDVQGAELAMLEGAHAVATTGCLRFLVLSTHHHSICGDPLMHQRCLHAVQEWGGHVIAEHSIPESFSGDGLIVASFDARDRDLHVQLSRARARDSLFGELEHDLAHLLYERDRLREATQDSGGAGAR